MYDGENSVLLLLKNKAASDYAMLVTPQNSVFLWGMVKHGTRKKSRKLDLNNKTKCVELYNSNSFSVYKQNSCSLVY